MNGSYNVSVQRMTLGQFIRETAAKLGDTLCLA